MALKVNVLPFNTTTARIFLKLSCRRYYGNRGIFGFHSIMLQRKYALPLLHWQKHLPWSRSESSIAFGKEKKKKRREYNSARQSTLSSFDRSHKKKSYYGQRDQQILCEGCGAEMPKKKQRYRTSREGFIGNSVGLSWNDSVTKGKMRYVDPFLHKTGKVSLCSRCQLLERKSTVGKNWEVYDALKDVEPNVFEEQLKYIVSQRRYGMCIQVVDASDVEGSTIASLRKLIGKVPVMLAINKMDLLPGNDETGNDVKYLRQRAEKYGTRNILGAYGVSAKTGEGVYELGLEILRNLRGNDVFVVGATNVGKSTLVRKLTRVLADALKGTGGDEERRAQLEDWDGVTESHLPGTTLQAIRIPCLPSEKQALWDTPGIIFDASLAYHNFPSYLMEPLARPEPIIMQPHVFQVLPGYSLLILASWTKDDTELDPPVLARIDVMECESRFVEVRPFLRPGLKVKLVRTDTAPRKATLSYDNEKSYTKDLSPYTKMKSVDNEKIFNSRNHQNNLGMDVVFPSLGWLSCHSFANYILEPLCIQGSRYYKRVPRLYSKKRVDNLLTEGVSKRKPYKPHPKTKAYYQALKDAARDGKRPTKDTKKHYRSKERSEVS